MDNPLTSYGPERACWLESQDSDAPLGATAQSDGLFVLAEQLARDSAWSWLGALAAMLREIHLAITPHVLHSDPEIADRDAREDLPTQAPSNSTEQMRRIAERYRALVRVSAALTRTLTVVKAGLAHVDPVLPTPRSPLRQRLSRWQERRAKSYLLANLASRIPNAELAAVCGLSRNYFVTAFRQCTGETPHACLLRYRIEKAKQLLHGPMAVAEVALACGFSDQSHLTRVFRKHTGIAPGEWRRERRHERLQDPRVPLTRMPATSVGPAQRANR